MADLVKSAVGDLMALLNHDVLIKVAEVVGGEDAIKIVEILEKVDEITDEEIVAKTEIKLNTVRKILYKLYDHSLVGLRRTRDDKTGWFIFHWRLQPDQIEGFLINQKKRILEKLEERLNYEKSHDFYYCGVPGHRRIPFEEATEYIFRCPECDKPLMHYDNSRIIEFLTKKIEQLRAELQ
ncbi:transcription factor [Candidatus Bathyarchaeota archaeon]|nr:MAG: transcription factor [Candidatus Bathyarchaeota archaeon]